MPGIPDHVIEQVRAASDIVEVIGAYLPLKRAGGDNFKALCPFHKEKTPSFHVTPSKQMYYCFGCHKGGTVFTFLQDYENMGFIDAVRRLAERANIVIEFENNPVAAQSRHLKDQLLDLHEQITQRWQTALQNEASGQIARDYLAKRGVSEEAVTLFRLGYAPEAWDDTVNWSKSKNFDIKLVEQAGLVVRKEGTDRHYDRFRGRLMFPICDEQGRVVAFSGRILTGDEKVAKYVNSPETAIFSKGKTMFGLDKSKRALLDAKAAVICEGQLDLIACFMAGVKNIVAPQGTALTSDHANILKRYVGEVILCFDADNAGQNAAERAMDIVLPTGLALRVATIPPPHDPDSFIKEFGAEAFQERIQKAQGFFDWYLDRLCKLHDVTTDRGRVTVVQTMSQAVHKTNSEVLLDTYAQSVAIKLGINSDAVRKEFKKGGRSPQPAFEREERSEKRAPLPKPPQLEWWLLRLLLETDDYTDWIAQHLDLTWISHATVREIIRARIEAHANGAWPGVATWLTTIGNADWQAIVAEVLSDPKPIPHPEATLKGGTVTQIGNVQTLRNAFIDQQMEALHQRILRPDVSEEDKRAAILQKNQLRELKKQPLRPLIV